WLRNRGSGAVLRLRRGSLEVARLFQRELSPRELLLWVHRRCRRCLRGRPRGYAHPANGEREHHLRESAWSWHGPPPFLLASMDPDGAVTRHTSRRNIDRRASVQPRLSSASGPVTVISSDASVGVMTPGRTSGAGLRASITARPSSDCASRPSPSVPA